MTAVDANSLFEVVRGWRAQGEVLDIHAEVDPVHEVAAITAEVMATTNHVVVFHAVRGHSMPVVTNLYGSRKRLHRILGVGGQAGANPCQALNTHIARCLSPGGPVTVAAGGAEPRIATRISELPVLTYHEQDAGAYITSGILIVRDPASGVHNLSFHRALCVSDEELRISIGPRHDLGAIQRAAEARGEAVDAVFLVGASPALFMAACTSIPPSADELALAASIAGAPIAVRPALTVDLQVPDAADIVIEGRILAHERRPEAPFGEWMGNYVPAKLSHVFQVTRAARKPKALFQGLVCGSNDDLRPLELTTAARIYKALSSQFSGVLDVVCFPTMLCTAVQVRQEYEGQARQVLLAAVTAHFLYSKVCFVVDEDVDVYSLEDVMWAYLTRARPDERTLVLGNLPGFFRDPHKDHWGRLALDATIPWGREAEFKRKTIPGRAKVDLARLLQTQPIQS